MRLIVRIVGPSGGLLGWGYTSQRPMKRVGAVQSDIYAGKKNSTIDPRANGEAPSSVENMVLSLYPVIKQTCPVRNDRTDSVVWSEPLTSRSQIFADVCDDLTGLFGGRGQWQPDGSCSRASARRHCLP